MIYLVFIAIIFSEWANWTLITIDKDSYLYQFKYMIHWSVYLRVWGLNQRSSVPLYEKPDQGRLVPIQVRFLFFLSFFLPIPAQQAKEKEKEFEFLKYETRTGAAMTQFWLDLKPGNWQPVSVRATVPVLICQFKPNCDRVYFHKQLALDQQWTQSETSVLVSVDLFQ